MNYVISMKNNLGYKWYDLCEKDKKIFVKGLFIIDDTIYQGMDLAEYVMAQTTPSLLDSCKLADGHFSIVIYDKSGVTIISDHMRSFPIFIVKSKLYTITDTIDGEYFDMSNFDYVQKRAFENALFTFEEKTLFSNITQVPAGSYCTVSDSGIIFNDYWKFSYAQKQVSDIDTATSIISKGYDKLFSLCKNLVGDRTVVLPLSGGYDSRLVLNGLLKNGMDRNKIIAFTYGIENYEDGILSKQIADSVGIRHYFIDYNSRNARKFFSKNFSAFSSYAAMTVSVPCIQEWYAVCMLKEQGIIDENCVFMPGYGGILPGHYVRDFMFHDNDDTRELIIRHIKSTLLQNKPRSTDSEICELQDLLIGSKYFSNITQSSDFIEAYERLMYSEEQSKFILNAVRDYEFVGCQWITPFFLKMQYDVWGMIDNSLRLENRAFLKCMDTYYLPELRKLPFTGSKVKKISNRRFINKVIIELRLIFNRTKCHYLFGTVPIMIYYKTFLQNKLTVSINHLVACEYLKSIMDKKKK